jgi:polysaccharide biosynthesis protein PslH
MLGSLFSPLPWSVRKHCSSAMITAVRRALLTDCFDLLHCDSTLVAPSIPADTPLPKVLDAHNVESVVWERYLGEEERLWMLPFLRSQLAKTIKYESQLVRLFDCCVAVSEQDLEELRTRFGCTAAEVVPNGIDLDFYTPLPEAHTPTIVFIGSLDYRPNKDAIRWFIKSIWPRVRAEIPEVEMLLVGRRPPRWIAELCRRANILLHVDVPDTRPYLEKAALMVAPIRIGGGTRLKILEAMAAGRCVVSTSIGAEGLDVRNGEHMMVADDSAEFAQTVISLLHDPARRQALGRAGRILVEAKYSWDQATSRLEEIWNQVVARSHGPGKLFKTNCNRRRSAR